jgi:hypothetical protein
VTTVRTVSEEPEPMSGTLTEHTDWVEQLIGAGVVPKYASIRPSPLKNPEPATLRDDPCAPPPGATDTIRGPPVEDADVVAALLGCVLA